MSIRDRAGFARVVTQLFTKRRKQLGSIVGAVDLPEGVSREMRPETLSPGQIDALWGLSR